MKLTVMDALRLSTLEKTIEQINSWYVGWVGYFEMTYYPTQLKKIEAHIRRRLRSRLVDQQKSKRNLHRKLMKRGCFSPSIGKSGLFQPETLGAFSYLCG